MSHFRLRLAIVVGALLALAGSTSGFAASDGVVISQVYGAGGNTGASFTHDFIELFNRGTTPVVLDGMSVQYASATGTGALGANAGQLTELSGTIQPGKYLLIHESSGAVGAAPPATDIVDATPIAMAAGAGKVALATGTTTLNCNTAATCTAAGTLGRIVDLVGYGNATFFEGAAAAPTLNATSSAVRAGSGCTETDDNAADFAALSPPAPRNSATTAFICGGTPTPTRPDCRRCGHTGFGSRRRELAPHRHGHAGREPDEYRHHRHRRPERDRRLGHPVLLRRRHERRRGRRQQRLLLQRHRRRRDHSGREEPAGRGHGRPGADGRRPDRAHRRGAAGSSDRDQRDPGCRASLAPQRRDGHHDRHRDREDRQQLLHPGSDARRQSGHLGGPPGLRVGCHGRRQRRRRGQRPRHG